MNLSSPIQTTARIPKKKSSNLPNLKPKIRKSLFIFLVVIDLTKPSTKNSNFEFDKVTPKHHYAQKPTPSKPLKKHSIDPEKQATRQFDVLRV
jgi:hypothetical protein